MTKRGPILVTKPYITFAFWKIELYLNYSYFRENKALPALHIFSTMALFLKREHQLRFLVITDFHTSSKVRNFFDFPHYVRYFTMRGISPSCEIFEKLITHSWFTIEFHNVLNKYKVNSPCILNFMIMKWIMNSIHIVSQILHTLHAQHAHASNGWKSFQACFSTNSKLLMHTKKALCYNIIHSKNMPCNYVEHLFFHISPITQNDVNKDSNWRFMIKNDCSKKCTFHVSKMQLLHFD